MQHLTDTAAIFRYHQSLIADHGAGTSGALGWLQPTGQLARFDMLSHIANLDNCSILDAGCGYADLLPFLQNKYKAIKYYGLEQMPELLSVAAGKYPHETFLLGDLMGALPLTTDYVFACGTLSYHHHDPGYIFKAIEKLYSHCRLGTGFNLLSGGIPKDSLLVTYNPDEIFNYCKSLSTKAVLQQGYWENDFTIFIYR